jgi:hypothetical protein
MAREVFCCMSMAASSAASDSIVAAGGAFASACRLGPKHRVGKDQKVAHDRRCKASEVVQSIVSRRRLLAQVRYEY